jgi:hypothetical protein
MATINISDLHSTGADLFSDSESYMNELTENELFGVNGGIVTTPVCAAAAISSKWCVAGAVGAGAFAASYIKGRWL